MVYQARHSRDCRKVIAAAGPQRERTATTERRYWVAKFPAKLSQKLRNRNSPARGGVLRQPTWRKTTMTETTRSCIDCGEPIQYPESRCPGCYDDWLETPEGSADKRQVEKWARLMASWIGKSGPGADLARAICWLTKNVETGDAAEFGNVAREVLYALNLAGQGLGDTRCGDRTPAAGGGQCQQFALPSRGPGGSVGGQVRTGGAYGNVGDDRGTVGFCGCPVGGVLR